MKALVVLSGGQDSVTCLGYALQMYDEVEAIGFSYGQKHSVELACATKVCNDHNVPFTVINIPAFAEFNDSALLAGSEQDVNEMHEHKADLPASFVPARNATFLTIAHGYAQKINANHLITGVCQTDYSGYPDCRQSFVELLEIALNNGYETDIKIVTPLMHLTKAQTFELAETCGFLETVIKDSHTCYNGDRTKEWAWGYGCAECPACDLRRKGWNEYINGEQQ